LLSGIFKPLILGGYLRKESHYAKDSSLKNIRGERGVMKARILVLIGDVEGESLNFKMEFVKKLNYCNLERSEAALYA
jgi:hypothetical protein